LKFKRRLVVDCITLDVYCNAMTKIWWNIIYKRCTL